MSYTKGPWSHHEIKDPLEGPGYEIEGPAPFYSVATVFPHDVGRSVCEANARLIAAAPTLLDACKSVLDFLKFGGEPGYAVMQKLLADAIAIAEEGRG